MPSVIRYRPALRAVVVTAGGSSGSSVPFCRIWSQVCGGRRLQHVIREEKPAVARHHHHLHLVGKPLGDNLLNQERAYFKAAASVFMRAESAADVTRMRSASASAISLRFSRSARLSPCPSTHGESEPTQLLRSSRFKSSIASARRSPSRSFSSLRSATPITSR